MNKVNTILVGVDFSEGSRAALAQALRLAEWNQAQVHIMHVFEPASMVAHPDFPPIPIQSLLEETQKASQKRLEEFMQSVLEDLAPVTGVDVEPPRPTLETMAGTPFADLITRVNDRAADLLVLGSFGANHRGRRAGAVATKCVRKAPAAVMLIRADHRGPFKHVVCGVDFSEPSRRAVEYGLNLAAQDDARLSVLHVFTPPWQFPEYTLPDNLQSPEYRQAYQKVHEIELDEFLHPFQIESQALKIDRHVIEAGGVSTGITEFIERTEADLVVMGTRGRTGLKTLLLGTTAERILRDAPCSILTVKPEGFAYEVY